MVQEIIQYPTQPSQAFDGVVRHYDASLHALLQDLQDTIIHHNLDGLTAYQIGSAYAVMVVRHEGKLLEIINPIIITKEGSISAEERTSYYPDLQANTTRYQKIKLMYEDREGKQHFLSAEDDLAVLIQRKSDYLLGSDFRIRMSEDERNAFDSKLKGQLPSGTKESCPADQPKLSGMVLKVVTVSLITGVIIAIVGLFSSYPLLRQAQIYLLLSVLLLLIMYFFVARHEGKKYAHCTSCQIGNIVGTIFLQSIRLGLLAIASYFIFV